jgi:hypothetical protein
MPPPPTWRKHVDSNYAHDIGWSRPRDRDRHRQPGPRFRDHQLVQSYSVSYEAWDTRLAACVHVDVSGRAMHPSFAFPWSVGFSPTCGSYVAMQNVTSYGAGSYFAQYNTGNPATWSGGTYNPCFDAVFKPTITVTIGTTPTSDTLTFTGKFCVR